MMFFQPCFSVSATKNHVVIALIRFLAEAVARRDVRFDAQDRFDAAFLGFLVKFDRAVKYAMIGKATASMPSSFTRSTSVSILVRPSRRE
jgi:hypothetical protein